LARDSDALTVNLREIATVDAELQLIEAEANFFKAEAQLHAATAAELTSASILKRDGQPLRDTCSKPQAASRIFWSGNFSRSLNGSLIFWCLGPQ
jgi:hypothetical protein